MDSISNDTDLKEISNPIKNSSPSKTSMKISKNMIIIILASLLFFSFLGVNIFHNVASIVYGFIARILSVLGFYTGAVINTAADVAGDTAKGGVDIAEGTIHSVGNLLQNEDNINGDTTVQQQWNWSMFNLNPSPKSSPKPDVPKPDVVQTVKKDLDEELNNGLKQNIKFSPSTSAPSGKKWCPVGYSNGSGKCIQIDETDKCMFGKVFDTEDMCENEVDSPPFKGYASQEREINWGRPPPPPPPGALTPPYQPQMFNDLPGQSCNRMPSYSNVNTSTLPIINKPVHYAKPMSQTPFPPNNSMNTSQTPPYRPESNYSSQSLPTSSNQNNNNNASSNPPDNPSNNNVSPNINTSSNNTANFNNNNYTPLTNSHGSASLTPSTSNSTNLSSSIYTLSERVDELSDILNSKYGTYSPSSNIAEVDANATKMAAAEVDANATKMAAAEVDAIATKMAAAPPMGSSYSPSAPMGSITPVATKMAAAEVDAIATKMAAAPPMGSSYSPSAPMGSITPVATKMAAAEVDAIATKMAAAPPMGSSYSPSAPMGSMTPVAAPPMGSSYSPSAPMGSMTPVAAPTRDAALAASPPPPAAAETAAAETAAAAAAKLTASIQAAATQGYTNIGRQNFGSGGAVVTGGQYIIDSSYPDSEFCLVLETNGSLRLIRGISPTGPTIWSYESGRSPGNSQAKWEGHAGDEEDGAFTIRYNGSEIWSIPGSNVGMGKGLILQNGQVTLRTVGNGLVWQKP